MKPIDELQQTAARMLADYDALTPGELFARPVDLTIPRAYELQAAIAGLREERGETVIGYKIGCTSATIQNQLGVNEPIFGRLFDTGCFHSGARVSYQRHANLAVEGEFALRLGKALASPSLTVAECADAVAAVVPVIELHNYVLHDAPSQAPELIASNGMHAGFVIGKGPAGSKPLNLARGISLQINGVQVGAVEGPGALEASLESLRWLVGRLAEFGLGLREGQIVLAGSALPLFPVGPGDTIVVEAPRFGTCRAEVGP